MKKFYLFLMALLVSLSSMAWTVKFTNPNNWAQVAVYTFTPETEGTWPGKLMTKDGDVWTYEGTGAPTKIIFNNNNKGSQTGNLDFVDGATYDMNGPVGAKLNEYTVYFDNSKSNWSEVHVYTFTPELAGGWPGKEISKNADGLYEWTYEATSEPSMGGIIFNNGTGGTVGVDQTKDLAYKVGETYDVNGVAGGDIPDPDPTPEGKLYIIGEPAGGWAANAGLELTGENGVFTYNADFAKVTYFGFATKLGADANDWETMNANRYGATSNDPGQDTYTLTGAGTYDMGLPNSTSWNLPAGKYTFTINTTDKKLVIASEGGDVPTPESKLYIIGEPAGGWAANAGLELEGVNGVYTYNANFTAEKTYFGFAKKLGAGAADWETLNDNRYGATENDVLEGGELADTYSISGEGTYTMGLPNSTSWNLPAGVYTLTINPEELTLVVAKVTDGIENVEVEAAEAVYYNLQGVRVANPENGLYIRVAGKTATKVYVR